MIKPLVMIMPLELDGLKLITPDVYSDERGFFYESYSRHWFPEVEFVQANHAQSKCGVIRGLHYQAIKPRSPGQIKLVRVTCGKILDVAVDIRKQSPTLGKWIMVELSEENKQQLFIPIGFAHGYIAMSELVEVQYLCSNYYNKETESGIKWNDPDLNIAWPKLTIGPIVSKRDNENQSFKEYLEGLAFQ